MKTKFRCYSKRTDQDTGKVTLGFSAVKDLSEGDPSDFGTKNVWGELQINAEPGSKAAEEFVVDDEIVLTVEKASKKEEAKEDSGSGADGKPKK